MSRNKNEIINTMKNKSYDELFKLFNDDISLNHIKYCATSKCFSTKQFFIKKIIKYNKENVYDREKYISSILKEFDWFPELLYSNDTNKILIFKNVGVPITKKNKPDNLEMQFNKILKDMKSKNIQHNDIKIEEILMNNKKKIYLCDFGWGSINNNFNCGINIWGCNNKNKPGGWYDDNLTLTRLGFI